MQSWSDNLDALALAPEMRLLLACARTSMDPEHLAVAHACIDKTLHWDTVLDLAARHRISLLLERQLTRHFSAVVPGEFLSELQQQTARIVAKSLHLTGILLDALRIAGQERIQVIPYKGPTLAASVYGSPGAREFRDVDLLVAESDVDRLTNALIRRGYTCGVPQTPMQARFYLRTACELPIRSPQGDLIELQWQLVPRAFSLRIRFDQLMARSQRIMLGGISIPQLCPEDALVVLCVHGGKHQWERLKWVSDVSELFRSVPDADWRRSLDYARQIGAERFLGVGVTLANSLLGTTIPLSLRSSIRRDTRAAAITQNLLKQLTGTAESRSRSAGDAPPPSHFWYLWKMRERWRDKIAYAFRLVLTPGRSEWSIIDLPAGLAPLYSLLRIFRLLCRLILWPFRLSERRNKSAA